ncbi:hypothetical protein Goshw_000842 [Gossypium schwendimanii]|uniref:Uncharacterized protein n=1 Tax=Gossypium schwendimanii TaxID=34291 RepID=A0A7J9ML79_GOSSC|nr:hypothetical protein [Gossypium schwendimanii]
MATAATRSNPHPHILVFPYPAQGHMLPLLDLTHQLALHGLTITILVTPKNLPFLSPLLSSHPSSITPLVFPFPSHPLIPPGVEHVKDVGNCGNRLIMAALGKLEDPLFNWFNSQSNPPVAIISDFFLVEFGHLPGSPVFKQEHLPSLFKLYKRSDPDWEFVKDGLLANAKSWGYVLNSFDALEGEYVQWLKTHVAHDRVFNVGPLSLIGPDASVRGNSGSSSDLNEQVMTWLNQCPDGSVVYVCFGSQKLLRKEQMEALANGLEKSDTRFIWVVKPGTTQQHVEGFGVVPDGFEQRTAGQGLVIKGWAPQTLILNHKAVGGFLSHCGWNSVSEAIVGGTRFLTQMN